MAQNVRFIKGTLCTVQQFQKNYSNLNNLKMAFKTDLIHAIRVKRLIIHLTKTLVYNSIDILFHEIDYFTFTGCGILKTHFISLAIELKWISECYETKCFVSICADC